MWDFSKICDGKLLELFWLFKWNMIGVILLLNIIKLYDWINFLIVIIYVLSNNLLLLEVNKKN